MCATAASTAWQHRAHRESKYVVYFYVFRTLPTFLGVDRLNTRLTSKRGVEERTRLVGV